MRSTSLSALLLGTALTCAACAAAPVPPPSRGVASGATTHIVTRAGHKIAFHVIPGTRPAIVLDAGGGNDSSYWSAFSSDLARRTGAKIITYDRLGFGGSDAAPASWSLTGAIDDLEAGLRSLGATRGTILVSHSLAGEIATGITSRHPGWFAGAVMVDANVPEFFTDARVAQMVKTNAPLLEELRHAPSTPATRQLLALGASYRETQGEFNRMQWPAIVPVVVIVAETPPQPDAADAQAWRDAHAQFASKAPNRTYITAVKSSHDVAKDRPDLIFDAISKLRRK